MNSEFNIYEEEYQTNQRKLLSKFHTAPTTTEQDYREAVEEYNLFKQSYESMTLCDNTRAKKYKQEFVDIKNQYAQFVQQCSPTLAMAMRDNEKLADYTKQLYEAEGNAIRTQFELQTQTQQMNRMIGNVKEAHHELNHSEGLLSRMKSRACMMKIFTYSIIALIALGIAIIIWYKFFN